jgi:hypothetical protein
MVPSAVPSIVSLVIRRRDACPDLSPPSRKRRTNFDRLELDESTGWSFASSGHAKAHRGSTVDVGQREASLVEMKVHQRSRGTTLVRPQGGGRTKRGIALGLVTAPAVRFDLVPDVRTEEIGQAGRCARPKVEHASAGGMPGRTAGQIHVDVVLVREIRTIHVEDVDLSSRGSRGVSVAFLVGRQRLFIGMSTAVRIGDAHYCSIGEDDGTVASQQVAAVQTLSNEKCILI